MKKNNPKGERLRVATEGDLRIIEIADQRWRLRVSLEKDVAKLIDDRSGDVLCEQHPEKLGFTLIDGEWHPDGELRKATLTAFAIAWISLQPRH